MKVTEEEWLKAFALTLSQRFLTYREISPHPFVHISVSEVITQTYWVGRVQYEPPNRFSGTVTQSIKMILEGIGRLNLNGGYEMKFDRLIELARTLNDGQSPSGVLAAEALFNCLKR